MKQFIFSILIIILFAVFNINILAQSISPVSDFGTNPGNLNMYTYIPTGINGSTPVVIAMHGCGQTASIYAEQTGWNKLADLHKFYVVYPEQTSANNSSNCFNWFEATDQSKSQGEALSIKEMVDYMISNYSIDSAAIFVTGLSAGAGMSVVMLATYPEIFDKGAIMAGVPYKAATSSLWALSAMNGAIIKTATQWGDLVRAENPSYTGIMPKVAIFHGTLDFTVNINNATQLIKQWTNVNNADQTIDSTYSSFNDNSNIEKTVYTDSSANEVVVYYKVSGMGHAIALDTGACTRQGGATGTYSSEENFHSTYWAADFFDLITPPYVITGSSPVVINAANMTYSVPSTIGSSYNWSVPDGASITNGQGSNSITVDFSVNSGYIKVIETNPNNCIYDTVSLYIDVSISSGIKNTSSTPSFFYNSMENCIVANNINLSEINTLILSNSIGQTIAQRYVVENNKIRLFSDLKPGIYVLNIGSKTINYRIKIMVY
ncbi:MAG: PHB depolymerase family esterase [Bacteroidia bacterium]